MLLAKSFSAGLRVSKLRNVSKFTARDRTIFVVVKNVNWKPFQCLHDELPKATLVSRKELKNYQWLILPLGDMLLFLLTGSCGLLNRSTTSLKLAGVILLSVTP